MTLIVGVSYVNVTDTKAISDMVAKGADPQAAACSVNKNATSSNVCLTLASKNKQ
jgi:thiamine monophosphate kinase